MARLLAQYQRPVLDPLAPREQLADRVDAGLVRDHLHLLDLPGAGKVTVQVGERMGHHPASAGDGHQRGIERHPKAAAGGAVHSQHSRAIQQVQQSLQADRVLSRVPGGSAQLLYARVDMAPGPSGEPVLLEFEATEPSLFFAFAPGSAGRMADAILRALRRAL